MKRRIFWNWDIHYSCNYRCSYCFLEGKWEKGARENRYPGIRKWIKIWDAIFEKYGNCHIHLSGGEPFTYPDFFDLIMGLSERHTLEFSTNLSFDVSLLIKSVDPAQTKICASFHPEFASLDEFLEKALTLKENGFPVSVSFVAYPPHCSELAKIKREFQKRGIGFITQPFRGEFVGRLYPEGYTEGERANFDYSIGDVAPSRLMLNHYLQKERAGRLCHMGQLYGKIYASADVYRCCSEGAQKLGNLLDDEDFNLLSEPAPCEIDQCVCWKAMRSDREEDWVSLWR